MELRQIRTITQELLELVDGWAAQGDVIDIERYVALEKLAALYDQIKFNKIVSEGESAESEDVEFDEPLEIILDDFDSIVPMDRGEVRLASPNVQFDVETEPETEDMEVEEPVAEEPFVEHEQTDVELVELVEEPIQEEKIEEPQSNDDVENEEVEDEVFEEVVENPFVEEIEEDVIEEFETEDDAAQEEESEVENDDNVEVVEFQPEVAEPQQEETTDTETVAVEVEEQEETIEELIEESTEVEEDVAEPDEKPEEAEEEVEVTEFMPSQATTGSLFDLDEVAVHKRNRRVIMTLYGDSSDIPTISMDDEKDSKDEDSSVEIEEFNPSQSAQSIQEEAQAVAEIITRPIDTPRPVLSDVINHTPIASINAAIGINDRFMLIKELFGGSGEKFNSTLTALDNMESLDDALIYIAETQDWNTNSDGAKLIMELLERRFM